MIFRVWDKKKKQEFDRNAQEKYACKETKLIYCDLEGVAIGQNGDLYLVDECGGVAYLDPERFIVEWDKEEIK